MSPPNARTLPPFATTGIGSLPHLDAERALELSFQADLPYLPQLPARTPGEGMLSAALDGLPGFQTDHVDIEEWERQKASFALTLKAALTTGALQAFEPSTNASALWPSFLAALAARRPAFAKVQLAGPATVRWLAKTNDGAPLSERAELDEQVFRLLVAKARAMARAVRRAGVTPLLFLDEPGLCALDADGNARHSLVLEELSALASAVKEEGALVGIHCCANTDWPRLLELPSLDVLSIDARLSLDALFEDRAAAAHFLERGATLALGIVPTDPSAHYDLAELVDSVELSFKASLPYGNAALRRVLLTPACGLALKSHEEAERLLEEVRQAQRMLRVGFSSPLRGRGGLTRVRTRSRAWRPA